MTRTRYGFAILLQSFGIYRKHKRMVQTAGELHLMQEGEELLGLNVWPRVEPLEDLSMEYWNVRQNYTAQQEIKDQLSELEKSLAVAQAQRNEVLASSQGPSQDLFDRREALLGKIDRQVCRREQLIQEASQVKRRFEALKVKGLVFKEQLGPDSAELQDVKREIQDLKEFFKVLKQQTDEAEQSVQESQEELASHQAIIQEETKGTKQNTAEIYARISECNRKMSELRSELGTLDDEHRKLCRQIGRHLNLHHGHSKIRKICSGHRGLLEQVHLLRRSITWNKKLIARAGG